MSIAADKSIHLSDLADRLGARLVGGGGQTAVTGVNTIQNAGPGQVCFLTSEKHRDTLAGTQAAAVLVGRELSDCPIPQLVVGDANKALVALLRFFEPPKTPFTGIDSTATIDSTARIDPTAAVGPQAVVGPNVVEIGRASCRERV